MAYSTIDKPSKYFNTLTYTGDGNSPRTITGVGFQPEFTWIRNRTRAGSHALNDAVRGVGTGVYRELSSDSTNAEGNNGGSGYGYVSAFASDGFTLTTGSVAFDIVNRSGDSYVSWNWEANGAGSSNTSGTISSTVSANTTSGFSIVSYTGNGNDYPTGATIGHGLGVAPSMIITKSRTESSTNWCVYHKSLAGADYVALLNSTAAPSSGGDSYNRTNPTSTVFSVGQAGGGSRTNGSGANYISYCFAEVKGFSKAFSYTGNGSSDGTFVYTGFKPAWVLIKSSSNAISWHLFDNKRTSGNDLYASYPNLNNADAIETNPLDFVSNGFKIRQSNVGWNGSGYTYVGFAFAENPFVSSKGVPVTAR